MNRGVAIKGPEAPRPSSGTSVLTLSDSAARVRETVHTDASWSQLQLLCNRSNRLSF